MILNDRDVLNQLLLKRPEWTQGALSETDMIFLFEQVSKNQPKSIVEVGTASGVSSAVMLGAMSTYSEQTPTLDCFDILSHCYFDEQKKIGAAIDEMIPEQRSKVTIHPEKSILDLGTFFKPDSVDMIFIDANHKHPYPALDTIIALKYIKEGGIIIHHDINLPLLNPKFQSWGAKYVYGLPFDKFCSKPKKRFPNIGGFKVKDKAYMRKRLLGIIKRRKWDTEIDDAIVQEYMNH